MSGSADPKALEPGRMEWIEVEDTYLSNQDTMLIGRGKRRRSVPDPDSEPTEAWMFCYRCKRTARGVRRTRFLHTITGANERELERRIVAFVDANIHIATQRDPRAYEASRDEPMPMEESA